MKKIVITINTKNDAFVPYCNDEVARILERLASDLKQDKVPNSLMDINGNKVGTIKTIY